MDDLNFLDFGAGIFSLWGMRRGFVLGFAKQLRRLIDVLTGALGGYAVYKGLGDKIHEILSLSSEIAKPAAFLLSFGGAFVLVRTLRRQLKLFLLNQFKRFDEFYGALLGFGRNAVISIAGIFTAAREGSAIGRTLFQLLG